MHKGVAAQKRKKRDSDDVGTSTSPGAHNLRPRGQQRPLVDYDEDIEMSDKVESSDDVSCGG
jgi:hypothetical protein